MSKKQIAILALNSHVRRIDTLQKKVNQLVDEVTCYIHSFKFIKHELQQDAEFNEICGYLQKCINEIPKELKRIPDTIKNLQIIEVEIKKRS